jgi:ABC-type sugar transport system permease subunit
LLIFYAALKAVPRELYEAAAIDGANELQIVRAMVANSGVTTFYTPTLYAYNLAFTGSQQGYAAALRCPARRPAMTCRRSRSGNRRPVTSPGAIS